MTTLTVPRPLRTLAIAFAVLGEPKPQGSKSSRALVSKTTGKPFATMYEANAGLIAWRKEVTRVAKQHIGTGWKPLDCPIDITLDFTMPKPPSYPKTRRCWPDHSYDIDKCARGVLDGLTHAKVIVNDSRVVRLVCEQHFPREHPNALPTPGVNIQIRTLTDQPTLLDGEA